MTTLTSKFNQWTQCPMIRFIGNIWQIWSTSWLCVVYIILLHFHYVMAYKVKLKNIMQLPTFSDMAVHWTVLSLLCTRHVLYFVILVSNNFINLSTFVACWQANQFGISRRLRQPQTLKCSNGWRSRQLIQNRFSYQHLWPLSSEHTTNIIYPYKSWKFTR